MIKSSPNHSPYPTPVGAISSVITVDIGVPARLIFIRQALIMNYENVLQHIKSADPQSSRSLR
jgi:hypothetical protein